MLGRGFIDWLTSPQACASNSQILDISAWRADALHVVLKCPESGCLIDDQAVYPEQHKADCFSSDPSHVDVQKVKFDCLTTDAYQ